MTPEKIPAEQFVVQLFMSKWIGMATSVAAKLRIADHLADGPKTASELATTTKTDAKSLNRVLRALASIGLFQTDEQGRYHINEYSQLMRTGVPGSVRGIMDYCGATWSWRAWENLLHSVKTGETAFDHTFGEPCFDYLAKHPEESAVFNEGMTGFSGPTATAVVEAYDFSGFETLVDVGGGHGLLMLKILANTPKLKGIVFDSPHVVEGATPVIKEAGLENRCRAEGGDFFTSVPKGDAFIMKHIIHDWNDEKCVTILQNCRSVIPEKGKVLIVEMVIPPGDVPHPAKFLDLEMLVVASGQERTEQEFNALLSKAGFKMTRIIPTKSPVSIIEAIPAYSC